MRYRLDTNICIHLIRNKPPVLVQKLTQQTLDYAVISAITVAELQFGVEKSSRPLQNRQALDGFLVPFSVLDFDYAAALVYGEVRTSGKTGAEDRPTGYIDCSPRPQPGGCPRHQQHG